MSLNPHHSLAPTTQGLRENTAEQSMTPFEPDITAVRCEYLRDARSAIKVVISRILATHVYVQAKKTTPWTRPWMRSLFSITRPKRQVRPGRSTKPQRHVPYYEFKSNSCGLLTVQIVGTYHIDILIVTHQIACCCKP